MRQVKRWQRKCLEGMTPPVPLFLVTETFKNEDRFSNTSAAKNKKPERFVFVMSKTTLVVLACILMVLTLVAFIAGFIVSKAIHEPKGALHAAVATPVTSPVAPSLPAESKPSTPPEAAHVAPPASQHPDLTASPAPAKTVAATPAPAPVYRQDVDSYQAPQDFQPAKRVTLEDFMTLGEDHLVQRNTENFNPPAYQTVMSSGEMKQAVRVGTSYHYEEAKQLAAEYARQGFETKILQEARGGLTPHESNSFSVMVHPRKRGTSHG